MWAQSSSNHPRPVVRAFVRLASLKINYGHDEGSVPEEESSAAGGRDGKPEADGRPADFIIL